tara:strand:- start:1038 stop:1886 length:849 start_codon:yes stop_codon:yes gene_type:complete
MIIWLASYPKSGNTWVRSFLNSLFFEENGIANLNINIGQYPLKTHFKNFITDFSDIKKIGNYWKISQNIINSDKKNKFLKTHHILCNINGNNFTTPENTLGVIYIVRDPRNVVTSIMNHYLKKNYSEAMNFLFDPNHCIDVENRSHENLSKDQIMYTFISSWNNHYNSWKSFPKNYYLIKYENLIKKPEIEFLKLSNYLSDLLKIKFNKNKITQSITSNSFENLKKLEERFGFKEAIEDVEKGKIKFFNLGPKNKWQDLLDSKTRDLIEKKFYSEMKELNYL